MLVVVVIVRGMPVPVMQILEVIVVHDGAVAAPVAVDLIVVERSCGWCWTVVVICVCLRPETAAAGQALPAHVDRAWVITARVVDGSAAGNSRASVAGRCGRVVEPC